MASGNPLVSFFGDLACLPRQDDGRDSLARRLRLTPKFPLIPPLAPMADLKRWFKVWTSILEDPEHSGLSLEDVGRWARLGAMTALVGEGGRLTVKEPAKRLCQALEVSDMDALKVAIERLPNVLVEEGKNTPRTFCVTWKNWPKYQRDSTAADRMRALRSKRRGEEKRGEEKRGEEKRRENPPSPSGSPPSALKAHDPHTWDTAPWGTPEALAAAYNDRTPDELPAVSTVAGRRSEKARAILKRFPERAWWEEVFRQMHRSRLLRGLRPGPGHEKWRADFDWLLGTGKEGVENAVKVHDGRYTDEEEG